MSAETLMTASERFHRFFRIDMEAGGMIVDETLRAHRTLEFEIEAARHGKAHDAGLLAAAEVAARDFHLNMTRHGGMVAVKTEIALDTLHKAIRAAGGRSGEVRL